MMPGPGGGARPALGRRRLHLARVVAGAGKQPPGRLPAYLQADGRRVGLPSSRDHPVAVLVSVHAPMPGISRAIVVPAGARAWYWGGRPQMNVRSTRAGTRPADRRPVLLTALDA